MKPAWLEHYAPGVPSTIDVRAYKSLPDMFGRACARFAQRPAYSQDGVTLSYAEFDVLACRFAAWLQQASGLTQGDRIALMMPNLLAYPVALAGALRAGLVVVNVNPLYTARELEYQLTDAGAAAIVVVDAALPLVRQIRDATRLRRVVAVAADDLQGLEQAEPVRVEPREDRFADILARGAELGFTAPSLGPEDLAFLQYTGGTTGVSKGAMLTHGNIIANLQQGAAWYRSALDEGNDVAVTVIPLYHIFGMTFNCLLMLQVGALNRLVANARDLQQVFAALAPGFTVMSGVNTLYNGLLNAPEIDQVDFSTLKLAASGGASAQAAVVERWLKVTGCGLVEGYGLTETSPFAFSNPLHLGFAGGLLPLPSTEVTIRDDAGVPLPVGAVGEICIRGPQVMRGYWQQPGETAAVLDADGWLRTGDIGLMDARGALTVTDRKKDVVLVSAFNVFPNEVEAVLIAHPQVVECAVIGVPDERTGEALKAFVVARDPGLTSEALVEHCRASLTAYKVPRQFAFVDQLPKSPVGKILRRRLRS